MPKKLTVLFHLIEAVGHANACIGLAQTLYSRGHRIIFAISEQSKGKFALFGFEEIFLVSPKKEEKKPSEDDAEKAAKHMESGVLSNLPPIEKLKSMKDHPFYGKLRDQLIAFNPQLAEIIGREQPDLILVDHFVLVPAITFGTIPWVRLGSSNPLSRFDSPDLPPAGTGLPTTDRTDWEEHRKITHEIEFEQVKKCQNEVNRYLGYAEFDDDSIMKSPYLNVYAYPEELDYTDVAPMPPKTVRIDTYYRTVPDAFELPDVFKSQFKSQNRLIYVSLGSVGSSNLELMKRLIGVLKKSSHKFIVSRGLLWDKYELGENMWGEAHLPQPSILPMVDAVITHGGNNTVTETVCCGKPMIVLPIFADQFDNAQRIHEKGFGVRLDTFNFTDDEMLAAVENVTSDLDIRKRVTNAAIRIALANKKDKLVDKLEELVKKHPK